MALDDVIASRRGVRDAYRDAVLDGARARLEDVPGGEWDGVPALTEPKLLELVSEIFDRDPPLPSENHAEVRTPAVITVAAICPQCDLPTTVLASVSAQLVVDLDGAEVTVKTKSKARSHICYQAELPLGGGEDVDGLEQMTVPFGEVVDAGELFDLLSLVKGVFHDGQPADGAFPSIDEIEGWTEPIREQVRDWATAVYNFPGGVEAYLELDPETEPLLPRVLGGETDPPAAIEPCPTGCGSIERMRLADDWRDRVEAGEAIPIVGCGNPWHYDGIDPNITDETEEGDPE